MRLPPGVSSADFTAALKDFEAAVGKAFVFTSDEDVALYRDAYSQVWGEPEDASLRQRLRHRASRRCRLSSES
jgi:4-cresol dehydrogenase (hydroxylating)